MTEIFYTNEDDGIWLRCTKCDWRKNFGYFPQLGPLLRAEQRHIKDCHKEAT